MFGPYEDKEAESEDDVATSIVAATNLVRVTENIGFEINDASLGTQVEKLWDLETLGIGSKEISWVDRCLGEFTVVDGRYQVSLPFKENRRFVEDNYVLAEKRLKTLMKKLNKDPELLKRYDTIIKHQLEEGIIEMVATDPVVGEVSYSPHRAVIREEKSTTKIRIVYDLSAKNKGPSLNDCLYKGPVLTPLLFDVLLRFRVFQIAITADIAQAYLQILVDPVDRDFLRFLWYDDVYAEEPKILKFRFTRVIFGAAPSQFLLNSVVKMHVEKYQEIDPDFVMKMKRSFYVDDFNTSVQNYEEALNLYEKSKSRFLEGKFNLRKWRTNHSKLREEIEIREKEIDNNVIGEKILGIKWDEKQDNLVLDFRSVVEAAHKMIPTKRNVLKAIAGIYDPVGFIQPVMVTLKILFQKICLSKIGWDDVVSDALAKEFYDAINEIKHLGDFCVARCYFPVDINDPVVNVEMHAFSDGSKMAYGGCVYLKYVTKNGFVKVVFVAAKSRVVGASLKLTIPRVELLGNLVVSRLVGNVSRALEVDLHINKVVCWTDSQITLAWIKSIDKEFDVFVENRVVEIRKNVDVIIGIMLIRMTILRI